MLWRKVDLEEVVPYCDAHPTPTFPVDPTPKATLLHESVAPSVSNLRDWPGTGGFNHGFKVVRHGFRPATRG